MEALILLATLGAASVILGASVGANLSPLFPGYVIRRGVIWLAATLLAWLAWPSYGATLVLWKHVLLYATIFACGVLGGLRYGRAVREGNKQV